MKTLTKLLRSIFSSSYSYEAERRQREKFLSKATDIYELEYLERAYDNRQSRGAFISA